jgi:hypothetical protein
MDVIASRRHSAKIAEARLFGGREASQLGDLGGIEPLYQGGDKIHHPIEVISIDDAVVRVVLHCPWRPVPGLREFSMP